MRFLSLRAPNLSGERRETLARDVLGVLDDAVLAPLFGPKSIAEADIVARLQTAKGDMEVTGRIDRLAEFGR